MSEAYELFGCNTADVYIIGVALGDDNASCLTYYENLGIPFSALSGVEGGGDAIVNTYGIGAFPTYILIAPDYDIVEQDMWPISNTATFINYFESNGLVQADCATLSAEFTADVTEICEMDMVTFTDLSFGDITSWNWTFEGGDPATSTDQNPVVTYNEEGTYSVELEVSDGTETVSVSIDDYIQVYMPPEVTLLPYEDVCITDPPFELTGGSPAGGAYSGDGVDDGWFDPEAAGLGLHTINYSYTDANGCENFAEETILVDECTAIHEEGFDAFQVYPNPTTGEFEIKTQLSGNIQIQLFNILGTKVYEFEGTSNGLFQHTMNIGDFQNGVYLVMVKTNEETQVQKLRLIK